MPAEIPPGRPGNLTPAQEVKLKEFWKALLSLSGTYKEQKLSLDLNGDGQDAASSRSASVSESPESAKKKRRFGGLLGRKRGDDDESGNSSDASGAQADNDKYGQTKEYKQALANQSPEELRDNIWKFNKADDPDAMLLRFLRARKWDVQKALVMLISTVHWRATTVRLDEDIMPRGEEGMAEDEQNGAGKSQQLGKDFMAQIRMGKSFMHGIDKDGRPLCFVRARLHHGGDQSEESLERFTIFTIETARFMLKPPVDTAAIVFDLTNFSMHNMDYTPVKFMIKVFEANYPESLGHIFVYNSPWIFQSIWAIIRGWLDPVVAAKVHFTKDASEFSAYVDSSRIIKELGGPEDWAYRYVEPIPGENDLMQDTATRDRILEERGKIVDEYEAETLRWLRSSGEKSEDEEIKARRLFLAERIRANYFELDPYVRARSVYDRLGMIQKDGGVDMYADGKPTAEAQADGAADRFQTLQGQGGGLLGVFGGKKEGADDASVKSVYYDALDEID